MDPERRKELAKKIPKAPIPGPWRGFLIYGFLALLGLFLFYSFFSQAKISKEIPLSQVISDIKDGKVDKIEVDGPRLVVQLKNGQTVISRKEENEVLTETLKNSNVDPSTVAITVRDRSLSQVWVTVLTTFLPLLLMVAFFFFIFRQAREAGGQVFSFGQSRARLFTKDMPKVTFSDVAGVDEAKKELEEVVEFLKHPEKFRALGARTPKGVLLVGPAGTGKTLLARGVAGEAGVPFFSVAGSEFMEMLVGVGASRVRDLFSNAKKAAPSIIFIDEIESIGRMRGFGFSGGHDEREQTLNQILVEMDGFTPNDQTIVISATNRPDLLDPALTRPGRFDRRVVLDMPDIEGRKAIIKIHMRGKPFAPEVDIEKLARRTVGFSGADLANMLNEAAILAAREGKKAIDNSDLEEAATKVKLGPQKKRIQTEEDRKMAAYHEAGHGIVAHNLPKMDPVHRISIVARGLTGGHTLIPPQVDRQTETKSHLLEMITTLLGGRASEELVFNEVTTGAGNDLDIATGIAREMVTEFGMSDLGPINIGPKFQFGLWPTELESHGYSQDLAAKIDGEVRKIIDRCMVNAKKILREEKDKLDLVAKELLEKETLEGDEFEKLVGPKRGEKEEKIEEKKPEITPAQTSA
jgi:cell division protease FtsH